MHAINMIAQGTKSNTTTNEAFDFNNNILSKDTNMLGNMYDFEKVHVIESISPYESEVEITNAQSTCNIFGVDGLPSIFPKKKFKITQHIR